MPASTAHDTHRRQALATAGVAGLLLLLGGCGGGNTEAEEDPPVAPGLAISSDTPGVAASAFIVNFKFTAAASGFASDKVVVSGGSVVGGFSTASSSEYSLVVQPSANRVGLVEISVAAGAFRDSSGTAASTRAYSFAQACNTVLPANEPLLSITDNVAGAAQATSQVVFTLTFSRAIRDSFSLGQVAVAGGRVDTFTRVSATLYNIAVTPPARTSGSLLLLVPVGAYIADATGVANTVATLAGVPFQMP